MSASTMRSQKDVLHFQWHRVPKVTIVLALLLLLSSPSLVCSFCRPSIVTSGNSYNENIRNKHRSTSSSPSPSSLLYATKQEIFPVLSQIDGINWEGKCRYVDGNLKPANFILTGGTRYDLGRRNAKKKDADDKDSSDDMCTLTSFLVFPDGRSRNVQFKGKRGSLERPSMRLDPVGEGGPIYMVLTEMPPDTVLLNEVDKATGKIVMTCSLSIINGGQELVQVSHEVGDAKSDMPIEGHQIWRLKKATFDEAGADEGNAYRGATGR